MRVDCGMMRQKKTRNPYLYTKLKNINPAMVAEVDKTVRVVTTRDYYLVR